MGFLLAAAILVFGGLTVLIVWVLPLLSPRRAKRKRTRVREPYEEICESLENHPEEWAIIRRFDDAAKPFRKMFNLIWSVNHKNSGTKMVICREGIQYKENGYTKPAKNDCLFFSEKSKVNMVLDSDQRKEVMGSVEVALAKKLKADMNPETVEYRDGFFFCPHCGEKVDTEIVNENQPT